MAANSYITVKELLAQHVGMNFEDYSPEQLTVLIGVASEIIENYCKRKFGPAEYVENSQTKIDNLGRIIVTLKNPPVKSVSKLQVWTTGMIDNERLTLDLTYLNLVKEHGYMYYSTRHSPWSSYGATYPWVILGLSETIFYEVTYKVEEAVPAGIKYACALMIVNLLKTDYIFQKEGVIGARGIDSFKSDDYNVNFAQYRDDNNDTVLSPPVRQILDRYASLGQNSF